MQKNNPQSTDSSLIKEIETIRCDNHLQFPYYPVTTMIYVNGETYIAAKSRDTIIVYVIKNYACVRSYPLNIESLPHKSSISAIHFVNPELIEKDGISEPGTLYILVGYYSGYLFLIKAIKKQIKILRKFNKASDSESGFLSKTMSYLSGGSSSQYTLWQRTTIVKLKMHNKLLTYLFRNSILVIMSNLQTTMEDLQRKFEWMASQLNSLAKNTMTKLDKFFYLISNDFKLIRHNQKCIIAFEGTVSNYEFTQYTLFVGTYTGMVMQFETESFSCLRRINTVIAIKNLSIHQNLLVLCLQDDNVQLIDMSINKFINICGHQSFVSCALSLRKTILVGAFDGSISYTNPSKIKGWRKLTQNASKIPTTFDPNPPEVQVDQKSKLKSQSGIGIGLILKDILVFSLYENTIKIFKINYENLSE